MKPVKNTIQPKATIEDTQALVESLHEEQNAINAIRNQQVDNINLSINRPINRTEVFEVTPIDTLYNEVLRRYIDISSTECRWHYRLGDLCESVGGR